MVKIIQTDKKHSTKLKNYHGFGRTITVIAMLLTLSQFASAQKVVLRNNLVYDAALTPNLGFDIALSKK